MKTITASFFVLALLSLVLVFGIQTAKAADVTYSAGMTGIDCADCKRTISRAIGKMKGVKTIRIVKEGEDKHRLTIVTDGGKPIAKSDAVAALGKDSHYQITSWSQSN
jgi:hypothetical protein